ncbi:MAG: 50S ribosomal protein L20 [Acidobacteria bacterium]|nr:50S ribosomal protein L20 [Acidobacteriota bacterium]
MPRVKRGSKRVSRRKKILKLAKGYYGKKSKAHRVAKEAVERAGVFAYRDRRNKKRSFRRLWIVRINAAARLNGISYNRLIEGLKKAGVEVNRKMLADLAVREPVGFTQLAEIAKEAVGSTAGPQAIAADPSSEEA